MPFRLLFVFSVITLLSACASTPPSQQASNGDASAETKTTVVNPVDPYEGFNRSIFGFNNGVDKYFLKPLTLGYKYVTPGFVETGVSNFFSNLLEIRNALNALLQGKGGDAAIYTTRFVFNTTVGVGGLFDVASGIGLEKADGEDFGQTLATWGVNSGAYIVLPLLGPSTFRDGVGIPVDMYMDPINYVGDAKTETGLSVLKIVDIRAKFLDSEKLLQGDKYVFIRDAYLQRREYLINDGIVEDTFGTEPKGDF